jgi:hypothetical protein
MKTIDKIKEQQQRLAAIAAFVEKYLPTYEGLEPSFCGDTLDFDYPTHEQTVEIILALGGKWDKKLSCTDVNFDYTRTEPIDGLYVRVWCGTPPPNCRIVTTEVDIPAQVIPAGKRKIKKVVCVDVSDPSTVTSDENLLPS